MFMQSHIWLHILSVLEGKAASRKHSINIHRNAEEKISYKKLSLTSYGHFLVSSIHTQWGKTCLGK